MDWEAELIRLTLFFAKPLSDFPSLIHATTGNEPTEVFERPKVSRHEVAKADLGHFFLTQEANRIVLMLGVPMQTTAGQTSFASLGPYQGAKNLFYEPAKKLIADHGVDVTRVGFGPTLLAPVADRLQGYDVLGKLLPAIRVDAKNSEDLFWQINRPRPSKVIDGRINRLSRWSVIQARAMAIEIVGDTSIAASPIAPPKSAVRVELDINTPPSESPLPSTEIPLLLEEFMATADEIAALGDVP